MMGAAFRLLALVVLSGTARGATDVPVVFTLSTTDANRAPLTQARHYSCYRPDGLPEGCRRPDGALHGMPGR